MNRKLCVLLLTLASALALGACARKPGPPPDLTGYWRQPGENEWYHVAYITDDIINVYWYETTEGEVELFWHGTFVPPEDDREPYVFTSENLNSEEFLNSSYKFRRARRERTMSFTYRDGKLNYIVMSGHLKLNFGLEKVDLSEAVDTSGIRIAEGTMGDKPTEETP